MQYHQLVLWRKTSLMCHKIVSLSAGEYSAMCSARPAGMILKAIGSGQYREVVRSVLFGFAEIVGKRSLGSIGTADTYIVGRHQRVV